MFQYVKYTFYMVKNGATGRYSAWLPNIIKLIHFDSGHLTLFSGTWYIHVCVFEAMLFGMWKGGGVYWKGAIHLKFLLCSPNRFAEKQLTLSKAMILTLHVQCIWCDVYSREQGVGAWMLAKKRRGWQKFSSYLMHYLTNY